MQIHWIKTHDPATDYMERDLRKEAIERLALSLDMSPEDLLGYTNANHWTGRQVQLDRWRMFGYSKAEQFANSLADAYLRPALRNDGMSEEELATVTIAFDDSQVVISPDRTEDALKANKQGLISNSAAREALGWRDADAMEGEELDFWRAAQLRTPELFDEGIAPGTRGPLPGANGNGNAADGPPSPGTKSGVSRQESMSASLIQGAASLALHRCRELAGARIRHKCAECAEGQPLTVVASTVGPDVVVDPLKLVKGGADGFKHLLTHEWGMETTQATSLCQQLEVYAARTLFQQRCPELPSGFVASIEKAREVSDAVAAGNP